MFCVMCNAELTRDEAFDGDICDECAAEALALAALDQEARDGE